MFFIISSCFGSFYRLCSTETLKFCFNHNLLDAKDSKFFGIKYFMQEWFHVKHCRKSLVSQVFLAETANSSACLPGTTSNTSLLIFPVGRAVH